MRILFCGDLSAHARSRQRCRAFQQMGHEVIALPTVHNRLPGISTPTPLLQRAAAKIGFPRDGVECNARIRELLTQEKTIDLAWIEKGLTIHPRTLLALKKSVPNAPAISYSEDDMFRKANRSVYYTSGLSLYDLVVTTKSYNARKEELPAIGARRVLFVGKGFDPDFHRPVEVTEEERKRLGAEVSFIGTFEEDRAEKMLELARRGIEVRVWGNGWGGYVAKHPKLIVENRPLYGDDYVKAICASQVNLCFLRKANRDLQTDRSVEIPATASFMLAERTKEHLEMFREGLEAEFFDSCGVEELFSKVKKYHVREDLCSKIGKNGRRRCLASGYSHRERLGSVLSALELDYL